MNNQGFFHCSNVHEPYKLAVSVLGRVQPKLASMDVGIPSRELAYPTLGSSENHLQKCLFGGDMLVPRRVFTLHLP